MNVPPVEVLFLSDVEAELDAAAAAGLAHLPAGAAAGWHEASDRHTVAADFPDVAAQFGLP